MIGRCWRQRLPVLAIAAGLVVLSACAALDLGKRGHTADALPDSAASEPSPAASPFAMAAESSGNVITFAITNNSDREYAVSPYHFALIVQGTRRIVPYSPESATIDVPSRLGPGETIMGRAIFNEFPAPEGHKLVFKPGREATFAVITSKFNPLKTLPPAAPVSSSKASNKKRR